MANEIEELNLWGNNLHGSIPDWIGSMSLLEYLLLGENDFSGELPIGICDLVSLVESRVCFLYPHASGIFINW
jgi:hypothetical protein